MLGPALALLAAPPPRTRRSKPTGTKKLGSTSTRKAKRTPRAEPAPPPTPLAGLTRKEIQALRREYRDDNPDLTDADRAAALAWIATLNPPTEISAGSSPVAVAV